MKNIRKFHMCINLMTLFYRLFPEQITWNSWSEPELSSNLWTSSTKLMRSLRDIEIGHSIQAHKEVLKGLNACYMTRSHRLMRSTDHHLIPRHEHMLLSDKSVIWEVRFPYFQGHYRIRDAKHDLICIEAIRCPETSDRNKNKQRMNRLYWHIGGTHASKN